MKRWRRVSHSVLLLFLGAALAACGLFEGGGGTPGTLNAKVLQGGPNPSPLTVSLKNDGECSLSFAVSTVTVDGKSWFSVAPTTGSLASLASTTLSVSTGAPSARNSHTAVWTGTKMIVWGGI